MSFTYPSLTPNAISNLTLPDFGVQIFKNDDESETRRFVQANGQGTEIVLKYEGRTGVEVANLLNFFVTVKGLKEAFDLPAGINQHPDSYKSGIAVLGDTTLWRFKAPPRITTVYKNIYNFDCILTSVTE